MKLFIAQIAIPLLFCATGCARPTAPSQAQQPPFKLILVSAGQDHTCGLTANGEAYCWGSNQDGQLGIGAADKLPHPKPLPVLGGIRFTFLTTGYRHTCALTSNGFAYCWGANDSGQLGNGSLQSSPTPVRVSGTLVFESLSAGGTHTCGVTKIGQGYCWGGNWHGQLGIGSLDGEEKHSCCRTQPIRIVGDLSFSQVTAGGIHTCGLTKEGKTYCWGIANFGRLGLGPTNIINLPKPTLVSGALEFVSINPGGFFTCGVTQAKIVYCWGAGSNGELGIASFVDERDIPAMVSGNRRFLMISSGNNHTCAIGTDGTAYCWGANRFGQVGDGSTENKNIPVPVSAGLKFKSITSGGNDFSGHTCGITVDERTLCWGDNRWGQLGRDSSPGSLKPLLVTAPSSQ
jgi:alpha-tubulin suppressor-like RCC1 family protein